MCGSGTVRVVSGSCCIRSHSRVLERFSCRAPRPGISQLLVPALENCFVLLQLCAHNFIFVIVQMFVRDASVALTFPSFTPRSLYSTYAQLQSASCTRALVQLGLCGACRAGSEANGVPPVCDASCPAALHACSPFTRPFVDAWADHIRTPHATHLH